MHSLLGTCQCLCSIGRGEAESGTGSEGKHVVVLSSALETDSFVEYQWSRKYMSSDLGAVWNISIGILKIGGETELL